MVNLNLEFSGNVVRVLQINSSKDVILKHEISLSFNLNDELHLKKNKNEFADEFADSLNEIIVSDNPEFETAAILIGTEQTFLNVTPVDFNEDNSSISSHILWELSNYFPDTYKNFNIKYYRLNNNRLNENIDDVLSIAINKNKLEFISNLCGASGIKIKSVEIDHFAVEKCLQEKHQEEFNRLNILLIGCKSERLDFSLIENKSLRLYDFDIIERSDFKNSLVRQINFMNSFSNDLEKIFLYGDDISVKIKDFIEEQFQNLPVSFLSFPEMDNETKFSPLYGLALKNT